VFDTEHLAKLDDFRHRSPIIVQPDEEGVQSAIRPHFGHFTSMVDSPGQKVCAGDLGYKKYVLQRTHWSLSRPRRTGLSDLFNVLPA
jgi:hypothetical protein